MVDASCFEFFAHDLCERTNGRFVDVSHFKVSAEFVARAHTRDYIDARALCASDKFEFGGDGVDCINDVVITAQIHLVRGFGKIKEVKHLDLAIGID